ncbi:MAG: DUF3071 domain-containing protein [Tetrasphaera sp.]|nr:DUF3071 domain-containing protein [Tetrasphaera sp.]
MQDLRFIGVHEDGGHVLLADATGVRYRLALDERLRAAVRRRTAASEAAPEQPHLSAREVQALIRAGLSAEEVAERAGWSLAKVSVFEAPVLAERGHVVGLAMNARLHDRTGAESEVLSDRVERRLAGRGVGAEETDWDATRTPGGPWEVQLTFPAGGRQRGARWRFEHTSSVLEPMDDEARWLSADDAAGGQVPTPPRLGSEIVYDVDAAGGVGEDDLGEPGAGRADRTDALMTAIRETSHAGGRRGPRQRTRRSANRGGASSGSSLDAGGAPGRPSEAAAASATPSTGGASASATPSTEAASTAAGASASAPSEPDTPSASMTPSGTATPDLFGTSVVGEQGASAADSTDGVRANAPARDRDSAPRDHGRAGVGVGIPELPFEDFPAPTVEFPESSSIPPPARGVHPLDVEREDAGSDNVNTRPRGKGRRTSRTRPRARGGQAAGGQGGVERGRSGRVRRDRFRANRFGRDPFRPN